MDDSDANGRFKLLVWRVQETLYKLEAAVESGELKGKSLHEVSVFAEDLCSVHHLRWELGIARLEWEAVKEACQLIERLARMGWADVDRDEQCEGLSLLDAATGVMAMRLICAKERRNVISLFLELIKKFGLKDADVHELAARYRRLMEATGEVPEDATALEMTDD